MHAFILTGQYKYKCKSFNKMKQIGSNEVNGRLDCSDKCAAPLARSEKNCISSASGF
jgi:hypothetical protein